MVDLPPPDGPTRATLRPGGTCRLMPRSTVTSGRDGYANLCTQQLRSLNYITMP